MGDYFPTIDDSMIAVTAAIALFIIPSFKGKTRNAMHQNESVSSIGEKHVADSSYALLDWKTAMTIPWGVLLLIGGGLALAAGFSATGLDVLIAENLIFLNEVHYFIIILSIVAVTILAGEIMSNTAAAALIIPVVASLASSLSINPILLMVPVAVATSYGFMMPVGTPPNAIAFATGYVTVPKMARVGSIMDLIGIVVVTTMATLLTPLVWGS